MALTAQVKDELARLRVDKTSCRKAEVSAMLRFSGGLHLISGRVVIEAELDTAIAARRLRETIADVYGHTSELIVVSDGFEELATGASHPEARALQVPLVVEGEPDAAFEGTAGGEAARAHHARVREELPVRGLALSRSDPAIPTVYADAE